MGKNGLYQFPQLLAFVSRSKSFSNVFDFVSSNKNVLNSPIVNTITCNYVSFATWHSRLGHFSANAMKIVFLAL